MALQGANDNNSVVKDAHVMHRDKIAEMKISIKNIIDVLQKAF